jgi:hypothetical protein
MDRRFFRADIRLKLCRLPQEGTNGTKGWSIAFAFAASRFAVIEKSAGPEFRKKQPGHKFLIRRKAPYAFALARMRAEAFEELSHQHPRDLPIERGVREEHPYEHRAIEGVDCQGCISPEDFG